jgi:transcriptional regulator with XRE-family HTH domain
MAHLRRAIHLDSPKIQGEVVAVAGVNGDAAYGKRRRLATELRLLRDLSGLTGRELAPRIGISQSKISRIEAGTALPSAAEVAGWAKAVGAPEETRRLLESLTDAARTEVDTWQAALEGRSHLQDDVRELEATARRTRSFQPYLVPGLLQTPDYAQRVFTMFKERVPGIDVPSAVAGRMSRQLALYEEGKEFEFIITDGALRWRPGPPRLLLAQLDRIAAMSTKDNLSIGIIPLLHVEATASISNGFVMYEADDASVSPVVLVETTHAGLTVRAADDVQAYRERWSALSRMARFGDEARAFLTELSADVRLIQD